MKRSSPLLAATLLIVASLTSVTPARADDGPEQTELRSVANLSRLAIGTSGCQPATLDPSWTLVKPTSLLTGGTPNQKLLARVWYYGWALRVGTSSDRSDARSQLLDFITRQTNTYGDYATAASANEELTSSHYQLWSGAMAGAYLLAVANGGVISMSSPGSTPETAIRDAARQWWADEKVLLALLADGSGMIDAPGARFGSTGLFGDNPLRDDILRLLQGQSGYHARSCTEDQYYTASFDLQALNTAGISVPTNLGHPASGTATPRLEDTLCIYKSGSEYAYYFPVMRGVTDPLYWVEYRLPEGKTYAALPPSAPGKPRDFPGASLTTITGIVAGAATCPPAATLGE